MKSQLTPDFTKDNGLLPAIAQDYLTKDILMVAFINEEAWKLTLESGIVHYYSRSRKKIWKKGETSGNLQYVKEIRLDCDQDAVLFLVEQIGGAACHEGYVSCFYRSVYPGDEKIVSEKKYTNEELYQNRKG